jgi:ABC-type glycerol-3-phosphate transport system permease component
MTASSARVDVRKMLGSILVFLVIAVILIWTLFPIYWAAISSVKSSTDNYGNLWIPWLHFQPTLKPWRDMFALPEIKSATVISTQLSLGAAHDLVSLAAHRAAGDFCGALLLDHAAGGLAR